jgi:hypothetical protein
MTSTSPTTKLPGPKAAKAHKKEFLSFADALKHVLDGKRIAKQEWVENGVDGTYGCLQDGKLCLHKHGEPSEEYHHWILNDGDMLGTDWFVL